MSTIYGVDLHHAKEIYSWAALSFKDFIILKATEGLTFKDPKFQKRRLMARNYNMVVGAYHFARGNGAKKEASFFYNTVKNDIRKGEFLVLDFEIKIANPVPWCLTFLKELERLCEFKPMVYLSHSYLKSNNWKPVSDNNYGLWAARYGLNTGYLMTSFKPSSGSWNNYAIWQYTSRGRINGISGNVDLDIFYGSKEQLKKYGKK